MEGAPAREQGADAFMQDLGGDDITPSRALVSPRSPRSASRRVGPGNALGFEERMLAREVAAATKRVKLALRRADEESRARGEREEVPQRVSRVCLQRVSVGLYLCLFFCGVCTRARRTYWFCCGGLVNNGAFVMFTNDNFWRLVTNYKERLIR